MIRIRIRIAAESRDTMPLSPCPLPKNLPHKRRGGVDRRGEENSCDSGAQSIHLPNLSPPLSTRKMERRGPGVQFLPASSHAHHQRLFCCAPNSMGNPMSYKLPAPCSRRAGHLQRCTLCLTSSARSRETSTSLHNRNMELLG